MAGFKDEVCFDESNLGTVYKIVPNKDIKALTVTWILPYSRNRYKEKSNEYLSHVLGHEGEKSLLSYLIKEGLANGITTSNTYRYSEID